MQQNITVYFKGNAERYTATVVAGLLDSENKLLRITHEDQSVTVFNLLEVKYYEVAFINES